MRAQTPSTSLDASSERLLSTGSACVPLIFHDVLSRELTWRSLQPKKQLMLFLMLQAIVGFAMSGTYEKLTQHSALTSAAASWEGSLTFPAFLPLPRCCHPFPAVAGFAVLYGIFLSFGEAGSSLSRLLSSPEPLLSPCVTADLPNIVRRSRGLLRPIGQQAFPDSGQGYVHALEDLGLASAGKR